MRTDIPNFNKNSKDPELEALEQASKWFVMGLNRARKGSLEVGLPLIACAFLGDSRSICFRPTTTDEESRAKYLDLNLLRCLIELDGGNNVASQIMMIYAAIMFGDAEGGTSRTFQALQVSSNIISDIVRDPSLEDPKLGILGGCLKRTTLHRLRATMYLSLGSPDLAVEELALALQLDPSLTSIRCEKAILCAALQSEPTETLLNEFRHVVVQAHPDAREIRDAYAWMVKLTIDDSNSSLSPARVRGFYEQNKRSKARYEQLYGPSSKSAIEQIIEKIMLASEQSNQECSGDIYQDDRDDNTSSRKRETCPKPFPEVPSPSHKRYANAQSAQDFSSNKTLISRHHESPLIPQHNTESSALLPSAKPLVARARNSCDNNMLTSHHDEMRCLPPTSPSTRARKTCYTPQSSKDSKKSFLPPTSPLAASSRTPSMSNKSPHSDHQVSKVTSPTSSQVLAYKDRKPCNNPAAGPMSLQAKMTTSTPTTPTSTSTTIQNNSFKNDYVTKSDSVFTKSAVTRRRSTNNPPHSLPLPAASLPETLDPRPWELSKNRMRYYLADRWQTHGPLFARWWHQKSSDGKKSILQAITQKTLPTRPRSSRRVAKILRLGDQKYDACCLLTQEFWCMERILSQCKCRQKHWYNDALLHEMRYHLQEERAEGIEYQLCVSHVLDGTFPNIFSGMPPLRFLRPPVETDVIQVHQYISFQDPQHQLALDSIRETSLVPVPLKEEVPFLYFLKRYYYRFSLFCLIFEQYDKLERKVPVSSPLYMLRGCKEPGELHNSVLFG
jgi:hypothetical protein